MGLRENGAGDGNRTHVASLEGWSSTIELHPRPDSRVAIEGGLSILRAAASHRELIQITDALARRRRSQERISL
jgi:hypothetical protein